MSSCAAANKALYPPNAIQAIKPGLNKCEPLLIIPWT